jgi:hypothetical protein
MNSSIRWDSVDRGKVPPSDFQSSLPTSPRSSMPLLCTPIPLSLQAERVVRGYRDRRHASSLAEQPGASPREVVIPPQVPPCRGRAGVSARPRPSRATVCPVVA